MAIDRPHGAPLDLVARLWGERNVSEGGVTPPSFSAHAIITRGTSQLLVPMRPRRARAGSLIRWTDDMSAITTLGRVGLGAALWTGLAAPLLTSKLGIRVNAARGSEQTLHEYLADALGLPEVVTAAAWGPPRPNQKPILRVFDTSGHTVAFAKVGWNALTRELVDNEAAFFADRPPVRTIRVPSLLHRGSWREKSFSISEPLMGAPSLSRSTAPSPTILAELAGLSERYRCRLGASPYRSSILGRLGERTAVETAETLAVVDAKWGDIELDFGHWHGDWTPWNMRRDGDHLIVWDWERHGPGIPVGFDAIHYGFHSALARGADTADAFDRATASAAPAMIHLGLHPGSVDAVAVLYAIEMQARFAADGDSQTVPWLAGLVAHAAGRLART